MPPRVTHFEIYADDPGALASFYRELFGWTIERPPGIDYYRVDTDATGEGIGGGLTLRPIEPPRSWVHYVSVDSVDESIRRSTELGGKVLVKKSAVPKTAWYAVLEDPQGNVFAIWQADRTAFPDMDPEL
jgi:predicted enzyme related to lactoylglutathione lyase